MSKSSTCCHLNHSLLTGKGLDFKATRLYFVTEGIWMIYWVLKCFPSSEKNGKLQKSFNNLKEELLKITNSQGELQ